MRTISISILFLAVLTLSSQAQESRTIFKEDFEDNRHEWPFIAELGNSSATISGGFLQYHNKAENSQHRTYTWAPINPYRDFSIRLGVKRIAGPINNRVGIRWGSINSYHEFAIAFNGYYTVNTKEENKEETQTIVEWTKTTAVDSTVINELVVEKIDQDYFFSVNGQLVYRGELNGHFGDNIHLLINAGATVAYDYVYIDELEGSHEQMTTYVQQLADKLAANTAIAGLGALDPKGRQRATIQKEAADRQAELDTHDMLYNGKHMRNLNKIRKQFVRKDFKYLLAVKKRPVHSAMDNSFVYYNYERVNGRQVYLEFVVMEKHLNGGWVENVNYTLRPKQ